MGITAKTLGVIGKNRDVLFLAEVASAGAGPLTVEVAGVTAITAFSGRAFSFHAYRMFKGQTTFDELLTVAKAITSKTIEANEHPSSGTALPGMKPAG